MLRIAVLAAVVVTSTGCGEIEVPITRTKRFTIETATEACATVVREDSLDTEEARPYLDKVSSVEIRSVRLTVVNPNTTGDSVATTMGGSLQIAPAGSDEFVTLIEETQAPVVAGDISPLPAVNAEGAALAGQLAMTPPHTFRIGATGCFDQVPAGVELEASVTFVLRGSLF